MAQPNFDKAKLSWTLPWDADWVTSVCFLGPTRQVAAGNNRGEILVWDLPEKAGSPVPNPARKLEGHTNCISKLLCSKDGRWLISASYDHTIRYWDMKSAAQGEAKIDLNERARYEASQRRGRKVPEPVVVTAPVQTSTRTLQAHRDWICGLTMSNDEKLLISGDDAGQVIVWDRAAGKELQRWNVTGWAYALAISPDNKEVAVSERVPLIFDRGRHSGVKIWEREGAKVKRDLDKEFAKMHVSSAVYSPDGKVLVLGRGGEGDGKIYFADPATGKKTKELPKTHQSGVTDLLIHPDGKHLASAGRDTTVRIWTMDGKLVKEIGKSRGGQFKDWIHAISFSADGQWLAAADMEGAVQVWSLL